MIRVTAQSGKSENDVATHYVFAGVAVAMQSEIPSLAAFKTGEASSRFAELLNLSHEPPLLSAANSEMRYHGNAPIAKQQRRVRFWRRNNTAQLDIDGVPSCQIDFAESHIHLINDEPLDSPINIELVTGPALVLMLAELGIYCLHAACIASRLGTIAFIAESGVGKSTLSQHKGQDWLQIADDILPIMLSQQERQASSIQLRSDFPQLKLEGATPPSGIIPTQSLDYLVRLSARDSEQIEVRQLNARDSMLEIVRHTVAAKLFSAHTMRAHATFAKQMSSRINCYELSFPRNLSVLHTVQTTLLDKLEHLASAANSGKTY